MMMAVAGTLEGYHRLSIFMLCLAPYVAQPTLNALLSTVCVV